MAENSSPRDYYADLGVSPYATPAEIRAAYLRLAKEHHPDKKGDNDASKFRKIQEAYEKLRDVEPRPFNIFNPRKSSSTANVHPNAKFHDTGTEMEEMDFVKSPPSHHPPSGYTMPNYVWAHGVRVQVLDHPAGGSSARMCNSKASQWHNQTSTELCIFCMMSTQNPHRCPTCEAVACADCLEKIKAVEVRRQTPPAWGPRFS